MDIEKLKILSKKASEAGKLMKEVTAFKNFLKDKEHMHDISMSEHFKTLRDPLIEQQKKTDEKQDKVIEQLQKNQLALTSGLQDLRQPQIMSGEEQEEWGEPPEYIEPDAEKFWDDNLKKLIIKNKLKTSKDLYKLSLDELTTYQKKSRGLSALGSQSIKRTAKK